MGRNIAALAVAGCFAILPACAALLDLPPPQPIPGRDRSAPAGPVPDINELVRSGDFLYSRGGCMSGANPPDTCIYRYNVGTNTVDARGSIPVTNALDVVWNLAATSSGKLFASGTYGGVNLARI